MSEDLGKGTATGEHDAPEVTSPNTKTGEDKGSGGVFNNQKNSKEPSAMADTE